MKALKKLSCVFLAVLLLMSLSTTAFAAAQKTDGNTAASQSVFSITIQKNDSNKESHHTYKAYQIFVGDLYVQADETEEDGQKETLSNIEWGNGVKDTYTTDKVAKDEAAKLNTEADSRNLIDALRKEPGYLQNGQELTEEVNGYVLNDLKPGYYVVLDEAIGEDVNSAFSSYIVQVVNNVTMAPKADIPHVTKTTEDINDSTGQTSGQPAKSADYDIHDQVPFTLTATLPTNYAAYDEYTLTFNDTMSAGLTFTENSVKVSKVIGEETTDITGQNQGYTVTPAEGGHGFTLTFSDLKISHKDLIAGAKIVVEYTAELNENAVVGSSGNTNSVTLTYSNDPDSTGSGDSTPGTGTTPPETVVIFTFETVVNKVEKDADGNKIERPGASFILEKWVNGAWTKVKDYTPADNATTDQVQFRFKGVDDGYYRLRETVVPAGYNKCDDIYFEITAQHDENDNVTDLKVYELTQNADNSFTQGEVKSDFNVQIIPGHIDTDVYNEKGLVLPETGGIGTTIFYVLGGVLVAAAVVLLITKKRMTKES